MANMGKSILKHLWKNKVNTAFGVWTGLDTYQEKRQEGAGVISSAASGVIDAALPMMMPISVYMGMELATGIPTAAVEGAIAANQYKHKLAQEARGQAFVNAKFNDTQQAYTMRQAGMAIAERSKYNVNQAMLGNEAKYMMK